jgi:site-specific recombinase XerD
MTPLEAASQTPPKQRNPAEVYLDRLAPRSRTTMLGALGIVVAILGAADPLVHPWGSMTYDEAQRVRAVLAGRYAPATANKLLAAVRGTLQEAWRLGEMDAEVYHRVSDLQNVRGYRLPKGRLLSQDELARLFRTCKRDKTPAGARDAAILAMLYASGLRRSEIVGVNLEDWAPETGALTIRKGKGNKSRGVYVEQAHREMAAWLRVRGNEPGALFSAINKAGHLTTRRLSDSSIAYILKQRAKQAGVVAFGPHDLRRTFISTLLDAGADIATVQSLAGHANIQTTSRYDRRGDETRRKAASLIPMPSEEPVARPRRRGLFQTRKDDT